MGGNTGSGNSSGARCKVCGRALRDPASVAAGVGPVCAGRYKVGRIQSGAGGGFAALYADVDPADLSLVTIQGVYQMDLAEYQITEISLGAIKRSRFQARRRQQDLFGLRQLAYNIKRQGLINPPIVFASDQGFELIAGERRVRALIAITLSEGMVAGEDQDILVRVADQGLGASWDSETRRRIADRMIPARVYPALGGSADLERYHQMGVVDNIERDSLAPMEEAWALAKLREHLGLSQAELGERIGRSQAWVQQRISLLDLDPSVVETLQGHPVGFSIALARGIGTLSLPYQAPVARYLVAAGSSTREAGQLLGLLRDLHRIDLPAADLEGQILYYPTRDPRSVVGVSEAVRAVWDRSTRTLDPPSWPARLFDLDWDPRTVPNLLQEADLGILPDPAACDHCDHRFADSVAGVLVYCLLPACFDRKNRMRLDLDIGAEAAAGDPEAAAYLAPDPAAAGRELDRDLGEVDPGEASDRLQALGLRPLQFAERAISIYISLGAAEQIEDRIAQVRVAYPGQWVAAIECGYLDIADIIDQRLDRLAEDGVGD